MLCRKSRSVHHFIWLQFSPDFENHWPKEFLIVRAHRERRWWAVCKSLGKFADVRFLLHTLQCTGNLPFSPPLIVTQISSLPVCQPQRECRLLLFTAWEARARLWACHWQSTVLWSGFPCMLFPNMCQGTPAAWRPSGPGDVTLWFEAAARGLGFPDSVREVERYCDTAAEAQSRLINEMREWFEISRGRCLIINVFALQQGLGRAKKIASSLFIYTSFWKGSKLE